MSKQSDLLEQLRKAPSMVHWFSPTVLLGTAKPAVVSAIFGKYADRRLIHAALDAVADTECAERYNFSTALTADDQGAIWVDYVADLGDGFDSTYAIAYLLAQESLVIENSETLPRGQLLIMGGDQVYPTATRENYKERFEFPYKSAFPDTGPSGQNHPPVFLLPGNHDWYDGLVLFLAKFCRGRRNPIGNWRAAQHRSYFAIQLPYNWWVWGLDTQLTQDIDLPQANYFVAIAKSMRENAKVVLCSGVPSWLKAEETGKEEFYRGLEYIANIAKSQSPTSQILAVLSGDTHHYSRYTAERSGTQFIVSGGGGAFLHPTHHLPDTIKAKWLGEWRILSLKSAPSVGHEPTETDACYPTKAQSRKLLFGNFCFIFRNLEFCGLLGGLYCAISILLIIRHVAFFDSIVGSDAPLWPTFLTYARAVLVSPEFMMVALAFLSIFYLYADGRTARQKFSMGAPHAAIQIAIVYFVTTVVPPFNILWMRIEPGTIGSFLISAIEIVGLGGFLGGLAWGLYLLVTCWINGRHHNHAFSALRLDTFKHFLRMRISKDQLTIYPVCLDSVPHRDGWTVNAGATSGKQFGSLIFREKTWHLD